MKRKIKEQYSQTFFQIYYIFAEQELEQGGIIVTNYDTSLFSGMYILKEVCYLTTSVAVALFHGRSQSNPYVKYNVLVLY